MLTISELRAGQEQYYLEAATKGIDEYYTVRGEIAGRWVGSGTRALGLGFYVESDDLRLVLEGTHPGTGVQLASPTRKVPGFDLTFSAPKSASLLFAVGDLSVGTEVFGAHDDAVRAALGYLERHALFVRRGHAGERRVPAEGFIGAAFRHRTSRAGDPQLHTHVLAANLTLGEDGRWGTPDSRRFYRHARSAGFVYQAHLRHELSRRLGVRWRPVVNGCAEIEGVPTKVLRAFSRRRADIVRALDEQGRSSAAAAQIAALATRAPKDYGEDHQALRKEWIDQAAELGFDDRDVTAVVGLEPEPRLAPPRDVEVAAELTREHATFRARDVVRVFASHARAGAPAASIEEWASRFLAGAQAVQLGEDVYSTPEMLRLERALLRHAIVRRNDHLGLVPTEVVDEALIERWRLSDEQVAMVRHLTSSGYGVDITVGIAGSGKTAALDAARAAWEASGHTVIGAALAARAAARLQEGSGIRSHTLAALLRDVERPDTTLPAGTIIVVDEAGMVETPKLARLLTYASASVAKVVLVGDHRQLPEIGPGGAFRGLADRFGATELRHNLRQRDPAERGALTHLRAGEAAIAVQQLSRRGRLTLGRDSEAVRERMIGDWLTTRQRGRDVVMLASRRRDVTDLNARARELLVERGEVNATGIEVAGRAFAVGDQVMALSNRRRLDILNGDRATVTAVDRRSGGVTLAVDRGHTVELPDTYLRASHLTHGYATTIHKAQGLTCDDALLLADDGIFQEAGYTALTRGRERNHLYAVEREPKEEEMGHGPPRVRRGPIDDLIAALDRTQVKTMGIDSVMQRLRGLDMPSPEPPDRSLGVDLDP
jgi:conjugative relaxase-like TrwC/TraI family protein